MLRKMLMFAIVMTVIALMVPVFTFAQGPDWTPIGLIVDITSNLVNITEDVTTGYPVSSDTGPYSMGWAGNSKDTYCNTDRDFDFQNWISVAQWMRVKVTNIDRHILARKPGTYTITSKPMMVRIASNGDVLVTFQEIWGGGTANPWDAEWYEYPGKTYPTLANELVPQIPVDKKYQVTVYGDNDGNTPSGFVDVPAGDGVIKFLNSEDLHNLNNPVNGFDMQFQEIVRTCNTTGDYVLRGRVIFQCYNQMWYINPVTGHIDRTRSSSSVPPAPYVHNPM
jgi:hypothetical protein